MTPDWNTELEAAEAFVVGDPLTPAQLISHACATLSRATEAESMMRGWALEIAAGFLDEAGCVALAQECRERNAAFNPSIPADLIERVWRLADDVQASERKNAA